MKLNLEEMREIARTLPIGYYLGRKVPVFVEDGNRAYCDVVKGDVHIGVGLLQTAADHIDATDAAEWDRETLLRCLLYHEIGHLLLTPKWYKVIRVKNANGNSYREEKSNTILNIFEDERLERILSKYFMGVKFRKFVKLVCKGEGGGRKDDIAKIYRAIRLRDAPKDVSDAVDTAIKNLAHIISVTPEWGFDPAGKYCFNQGLYSDEVNDLVAKILDSKEESGGGQSQQSQGRSQAQSQGQSEQEQSEQEQSKQDSPEQPAPKEQSEQEKPDGEQKDEQKDDKSDGESDDKPDADDKSDAEDDSESGENSDSEESSGGDGEGDDGSDGESDRPDEEDSEGDEGDGDADGDADGYGDQGDGDQGNGDESDEDSDGDAKDDGEDADDADDSGADDADGGVDGDDGEEESSDGDATGDEADASGTDDTDDTEDAEDADGKTSCAVSGVLTLPPEYLKEVADKVFATPTSDIESVLRRFAQRIAKQKGAQAAGRWSALSGRIDPRRDAMGKDRIFRRSSDVGEHVNAAIHLTLWVDCSGSFSDSEPILNQILSATARAADMSGGRLDVDVVHMDEVATVAERDKWQIVADGDNSINTTYYRAWKATRRKDRRNIDVVVFDGQACCKSLMKVPGTNTPIAKAIWDDPDCHLIIDNSNEFWGKLLKKAHVTYMCGGYAEALQDEVIKLLDRIL